jgi:hypothetical protein
MRALVCEAFGGAKNLLGELRIRTPARQVNSRDRRRRRSPIF